MPTPPDMPTESGSCWACGYSLRGLPAEVRRCPDCGRAFDPNDPKSVNHARPVGAIARRALIPPGWSSVWVAGLAALLVVAGTGGVTGFRAELMDWQLLFRSFTRKQPWTDYSIRWRVYAVGVGLAGIVLLWVLARVALRWVFVRRYCPPIDLCRGRNGIAAGVASLLFVCFLWVTCGGAMRIGREWSERILHAPPPTPANPFMSASRVESPLTLSGPALRSVARAAAIGGDSPRHRRAALQMMQWDITADLQGPSVLLQAARRERDTGLLATQLRFLGMYRNPELLEFLERYLDDPRPVIRAAAADSVGLVCSPAYPIGLDREYWGFPSASLAGDPPFSISALLNHSSQWVEASRAFELPFYARVYAISPERRTRLLGRMLNGSTSEEREAAARALLPQPPQGYRLRFAEWGVWLNEGGDLKTARAVADEVPPFVHRTGNPIAEMLPRLPAAGAMVITKPVIHLSVDEPMSVDIEVRIRHGRPWFAYPMPDDFEIFADVHRTPPVARTQPATTQSAPLLAKLDPPASFGRLSPQDLRSGYPWIDPPHRIATLAQFSTGRYASGGSTWSDVTEMGVHWQSVVVTPTKRSWMREPPVGTEPRYAWWRRLREVECSWISSRGESERFLYYDGPTRLKMPFTLRLDGDTIRRKPVRQVGDVEVVGRDWVFVDRARSYRGRKVPPPGSWFLLAVRVAGDGTTVESAEMAPGFDDKPFDRADHPVADGADAAEGALLEALRAYGLNASESAGLLDAWRDAFFRKTGTRVLAIMPAQAYDTFCPLVIRPAPTELARVGIVLTELGGQGDR